MTRDEFKTLVKGMKAVYTQPTFIPDSDAFNVWYSLLKDLDYMVAQVSIQKFMLTSKFPPTIADIRELSASVTIGEKPEWSDGWREVTMAIRKYGSYREKEALDSMSDITRQVVKRMGFKNLCMSENEGVERANFRMIYEQVVNREYERKKMPAQMMQLIDSINGKKMLEG